MLSTVGSLLLAATVVFAQTGAGGGATQNVFPPFSGDPFQKYYLSAKGINATFIPYGARLTSLFVNDKNGNPQDVAVGYDEGSRYLEDTETDHTYVLISYEGWHLINNVSVVSSALSSDVMPIESRTALSRSMERLQTFPRTSTMVQTPYTVVRSATISRIGPCSRTPRTASPLSTTTPPTKASPETS